MGSFVDPGKNYMTLLLDMDNDLWWVDKDGDLLLYENEGPPQGLYRIVTANVSSKSSDTNIQNAMSAGDLVTEFDWTPFHASHDDIGYRDVDWTPDHGLVKWDGEKYVVADTEEERNKKWAAMIRKIDEDYERRTK